MSRKRILLETPLSSKALSRRDKEIDRWGRCGYTCCERQPLIRSLYRQSGGPDAAGSQGLTRGGTGQEAPEVSRFGDTFWVAEPAE
ncbi:unnamed protein product [Pieris macdunnoughi]|uniref:Uncharacterized protein n=1 Tax=Pieris macdunnoughi TaxID=345717 RepID=A0A821URI3_9NEOP|nr:unnamed protein product [Pieris macdunnoughi]